MISKHSIYILVKKDSEEKSHHWQRGSRTNGITGIVSVRNEYTSKLKR